jgi:wobble nucleotide-excising tRNase
MLNQFQLIRNLGSFDSVQGTAATALAKLTLIHAENGRGKTTLCAISRSLASDDPNPIKERT